jgi:hypothetical protein
LNFGDVKTWTRPRVCENPKSEISSGKHTQYPMDY